MKNIWLPRFEIDPFVRLRLFCVAYAGGGSSVFRGWDGCLPSSVQLCPVQLPGRESRLADPPYTRLPLLLPALADGLSPALDKPFALFGHSMGALVAFEFARYLRRNRMPEPTRLFVSGHRAPHLPYPRPYVHQLSDDRLLDELRRFRGTPEALLENAELMELILPAIRADFAICETYDYLAESPLEVSITAFGGLDDSDASPDDLSLWHTQTRARFRLRLFPGSHFFLHTAQASLLDVLSRELEELLSGSFLPYVEVNPNPLVDS